MTRMSPAWEVNIGKQCTVISPGELIEGDFSGTSTQEKREAIEKHTV